VHREHQLFQIIAAGGSSSSLARLLHSGQQQCHEYGDDGDYHQQFNQRKSAKLPVAARPRMSRWLINRRHS